MSDDEILSMSVVLTFVGTCIAGLLVLLGWEIFLQMIGAMCAIAVVLLGTALLGYGIGKLIIWVKEKKNVR